MKLLLLFSGLLALTGAVSKCGSSDSRQKETTVYKAKLEVKALCMNYTFSLQEGNLDTSLVSGSWTDETTGKTYHNAFGFANPCNFPASIQEGDIFRFVIDSTDTTRCAVCMAYYPTPPKKLWIKVVDN